MYSCKITYNIIIYRCEHTMEAAGGQRSGPVLRNSVQQSQRYRATATAADNAATVHSAGGPSFRTPGRCPLTPCPHDGHNNKNNNFVVINSV